MAAVRRPGRAAAACPPLAEGRAAGEGPGGTGGFVGSVGASWEWGLRGGTSVPKAAGGRCWGGAFGLGGRTVRVLVLPEDGIFGYAPKAAWQGDVCPSLSLPLPRPCPVQVAPSGRFSPQPDGSLHVGQASRGDAGTYTCVATNALGSQRQDVALVVHGERPGVPAGWSGWVLSPGLCCQPCVTSVGRSCGFLARARLFQRSGRAAAARQGRKAPEPDLYVRNGPQGSAVRLQSRLREHLVAL